MPKFSAFVLLLITTTLNAEIIFQPPGLEPGDRYRLVFVTSEVRDAKSNNIEVYNDFVQGVADAAPIIGDWRLEWKAVVSTRDISARDSVGYTSDDFVTPVYRVDGSQFTSSRGNDFSDFFSGDGGPISKTELNTILPQEATSVGVGAIGGTVWTGSETGGTPLTELGGSGKATVGGSESTGLGIMNSGLDAVEREHHFYALSQVITVVPEPSSSLMIASGLAVLLALRGLQSELPKRGGD